MIWLACLGSFIAGIGFTLVIGAVIASRPETWMPHR